MNKKTLMYINEQLETFVDNWIILLSLCVYFKYFIG